MKKFTLRMSLILSLCVIALFGLKSFAQENDPEYKVPGEPYIQSNYPPLRAGGEDMSTAVSIPSFPFTDGGTTCGAADDYSANCGCCGGSNGAPDLVYTFTAGSNGTITIALNGGYDPLVHVRDSDGNVIACNDDLDLINWNSLISNLAVTQGESYFIIVEGYASDCGVYSLSITGDVTIASEVPLSPWVIAIAIFLIGSVVLIRYSKLL